MSSPPPQKRNSGFTFKLNIPNLEGNNAQDLQNEVSAPSPMVRLQPKAGYNRTRNAYGRSVSRESFGANMEPKSNQDLTMKREVKKINRTQSLASIGEMVTRTNRTKGPEKTLSVIPDESAEPASIKPPPPKVLGDAGKVDAILKGWQERLVTLDRKIHAETEAKKLIEKDLLIMRNRLALLKTKAEKVKLKKLQVDGLIKNSEESLEKITQTTCNLLKALRREHASINKFDSKN